MRHACQPLNGGGAMHITNWGLIPHFAESKKHLISEIDAPFRISTVESPEKHIRSYILKIKQSRKRK
jgi:hypothetical protein